MFLSNKDDFESDPVIALWLISNYITAWDFNFQPSNQAVLLHDNHAKLPQGKT